MLKPYTIGMLEHTAKNDPTVVATADIKNGTVFTIKDGELVLPTADTAKGKDLWVAINTLQGDDYGTDEYIRKGEYVNAFQLAAWEGQYVELTGIDAAKGDVLVVNTSGAFEESSASVADYALVLVVKKVTVFDGGKSLLAQVVSGESVGK